MSGDPERSFDFGRAPGTVVRRLGLGEGEKIRALRMSALSDAPYAFGSSFEREAKYPLEHWDALVEQSANGERSAIFIAVERMQWMGMAGCHLRDEDPSTAIVWGMWVESSVRRRGRGTELLKAAMDWASSRGATRLELSVSSRAPGAAALYRALGFAETGEARPLASNPSITEILMARSAGIVES